MDYPRDFPGESRAKVEAARIRAGRRFDTEKAKVQSHSDVERLFWNYVLAPFLVFAKESCRLALWPTDKMDQHCLEFLRRLTIDAYCQKGMAARVPDPISNWNGSIHWEAQQKIEKAPQWRKYENTRLRFARRAGGTEPQRTDRNAKTAADPAGEPATTGTARNTREAFLRPILQEKGLSVNDWATQAGVDFHTANDYLNGKTRPYQSTKTKLAEPLGIEVGDMPA